MKFLRFWQFLVTAVFLIVTVSSGTSLATDAVHYPRQSYSTKPKRDINLMKTVLAGVPVPVQLGPHCASMGTGIMGRTGGDPNFDWSKFNGDVTGLQQPDAKLGKGTNSRDVMINMSKGVCSTDSFCKKVDKKSEVKDLLCEPETKPEEDCSKLTSGSPLSADIQDLARGTLVASTEEKKDLLEKGAAAGASCTKDQQYKGQIPEIEPTSDLGRFESILRSSLEKDQVVNVAVRSGWLGGKGKEIDHEISLVGVEGDDVLFLNWWGDDDCNIPMPENSGVKCIGNGLYRAHKSKVFENTGYVTYFPGQHVQPPQSPKSKVSK